LNSVRPISSADDVESARRLFLEYARGIGVDLCFQNFQAELDSLPGSYSPPGGALFLSEMDGALAGCIGLRPFSTDTGEIKRLYVCPQCRRRGIGRDLVSSVIEAARKIGYRALVLDTLRTMEPAIALYRSFGFQPCERYYPNPLPEVLYFRLESAETPLRQQ